MPACKACAENASRHAAKPAVWSTPAVGLPVDAAASWAGGLVVAGGGRAGGGWFRGGRGGGGARRRSPPEPGLPHMLRGNVGTKRTKAKGGAAKRRDWLDGCFACAIVPRCSGGAALQVYHGVKRHPRGICICYIFYSC